MYYYLFEPTNQGSIKRWQGRLKEKLINGGIGGEFTAPSPARTIDELILMGLDKGFSTTVAIGSDSFVNKVASSLIIHSVKRHKERIVLGFIYHPREESFFQDLLFLRHDEDIIAVLKARYLTTIPVGFIQPNKFFISPVQINQAAEFRCRLQTENYQATIETNQLILTPSGIITVTPRQPMSRLAKIFRNILGGGLVDHQSTFAIQEANLSAEEPLSVKLCGEVIAKTPITISVAPNILHFITNRDRFETASALD